MGIVVLTVFIVTIFGKVCNLEGLSAGSMQDRRCKMGRLTPKDWENQSNEIWLKLGYIQMSDEPFRTFLSESLQKLAHYEDLEEQGRLIEQKQGTWISLNTYIYECDGMWECSECGEDFYFEFGTPLECRTYYCPNCGAKLEELKGE